MTFVRNIRGLKNIRITGDFPTLDFPATKSVTITDRHWIAYHVELPPFLRKRKSNKNKIPPKVGFAFCEALAKALNSDKL